MRVYYGVSFESSMSSQCVTLPLGAVDNILLHLFKSYLSEIWWNSSYEKVAPPPPPPQEKKKKIILIDV